MHMRRCFWGLFLFVFTAIGHPISINAADHTMWADLGIYGGYVQRLAVDPVNSNRIFASTYMGRGLYLSEDGGDSWQALEMPGTIEGEDTFNEQLVSAVAVAPSNPDIVWAAHNYWVAKSTDGGRTWIHFTNSIVQQGCANCGGDTDGWRFCYAIAIDPADPDTVYVGASGASGSDAGGAVFATTDGGTTWSKLNQGANLDYRVEDLAVDSESPLIVWAVTNSNGYGGVYDGTIYRSENGGQTFSGVQPKPMVGGIVAIAPKPSDPNVVFVTGGYGIVQLDYDGSQWIASYPVPESRMSSAVVFAPSDPNTVYAGWTRPNDAFWNGDGLPKVSRGVFDGSSWSWETFLPDSQSATAFNALAVHATDAGTVFGGDVSLGVLISEDGGVNWTPANDGLDAVVVYDVDVDDSNTAHMLAASGSGLYERSDAASQWVRRHIGAFRSVAFHPSSSSAFYGGGSGSVARTTDNGATWAYSSSLGYVNVYDIAVDEVETNRVYITTGPYGRQVLRSTDGAATFQAVLNGINLSGQPYSMNRVAIDPHDRMHLFAAGGNFYSPYAVGDLWQSGDGGDTWQRTGLTNTVVNAVIVDPRDPNIIYAGCGYSQNYVEPLFKSTDGGATWSSASAGMPPARRTFHSIWSPEGEDTPFVVGSYGYIIRYDGNRWQVMEAPTQSTLYGVSGLSADNVYAVGSSGTILHFDGAAWQSMASNTSATLYKVWAVDAGHVYAVGQGGIILLFDGTQWSQMSSPVTEDIYEVRGNSADDIFASGVGGTLLHYDGSDWQSMNSGTSVTIDALWPLSADDVFAVGDQGVILRYDGIGWSPMQSNITGDLWGVWGSGADNIYAAGPGGHLLHFNGTAWAQIDFESSHYYMELWGNETGEVYLLDGNSIVWRYDGQEITVSRERGTFWRSVTDLAFHRANPDIVYASTYQAGVHISPNQGSDWLNLGAPINSVYAIASGSLYAATGSGMYQLTGTGVLTGEVSDAQTLLSIDNAQVLTDLGQHCRSITGIYMMVVPAGIFDIFALAENYDMAVNQNVTVMGSDVTRQDFSMVAGTAGGPTGNTTDPEGSAGGGSYCFIGTLGLN